MLEIFLKFGRKSENNSYHLILETYSEYFILFLPFQGVQMTHDMPKSRYFSAKMVI